MGRNKSEARAGLELMMTTAPFLFEGEASNRVAVTLSLRNPFASGMLD
jgi:hypothetical protein